MISIQGLQKNYGSLKALSDLNLDIQSGQVTAVLGPNGAGKTTLIKSILGLVKPDTGEITVRGQTLNGDSEYRRHIGYMPQNARYPENLTVQEILEMTRDLREWPLDLDWQLKEEFELQTEMKKPFKTLSGGNKQKMSAVLSFMFKPEILFLDEPTAGLDPIASSILKDKVLRERRNGRTIILTSHIMSEVQELSDRVVYLLDGQIHFDSTAKALIEKTGEQNLERAIAQIMKGAAA